jgi:PAS domain S-box-containing protein
MAGQSRSDQHVADLPYEALAQSAFTSAGVGIYLTDDAGRIIAVNPQAEALLGRHAGSMLGADAHELLHRNSDGSRMPLSNCQVIGVLQSERTASSERGTFLRGDGTLLPVAWTAAPMRHDHQVLGVVVVFVDIIERLRLAQGQGDQFAALESFTGRLTLVTEISSVLNQTLDMDEALQRLGRLIVPQLADWAVVDLALDQDDVCRAVVIPPLGTEANPDWPGPLPGAAHSPGSPLSRVLNQGETLLLRPDDLADLGGHLGNSARCDLFGTLGATSAIVVPLRTARHVLGALTVVRTDPGRPFDTADMTLITDIGRRAGLALDNARMFGQQREVAETMQRHLLTPLPEVGHLQMAARYLPAPEVSQVGGDWYDAFVLPDGATGLVIGDVMGHDLKAAAEMAQVRGMVRTLAWDRCESPAEIIGRLDRAMTALTDVPMATMIFGRVEGARGGPQRLRWSSAGHPAPLLVTRDGRAGYLKQSQGLLLGLRLGPTRTRRDSVTTLPPESTLLLYTDGLIESPTRDLATGMAQLRHHAASLGCLPLEEFCDEILERVPLGSADDVALLALRLPRQ